MQKKIFDEYRKRIEQNPEKFSSDFRKIIRKMKQSNAKYKGKTVNFLYQPMFFDQEDVQNFQNICKRMMGIIQKCVEEYLQNPAFRKHFGFSNQMEELILIDPGYSCAAPIARLDIFYDGDYSFCELNGDGTSAMNEANTLERIFLESDIIRELQKTYRIYNFELFHSWLEALLQIYQEFGGTRKPNIAIVDFSGLGTSEEFKTFQTVFEKDGYTTVICDPREMKYKNGRLYFGKLPIDLVYRRAVNQEMEKRLHEVGDFIQAYKDKAVCVVGPFRSQIMHNKTFFSILSDENKTGFLNSEERQFITKHIPQTWQLNEKHCQLALDNKDAYVIKPKDFYGGKGVVCGLDCTEDEWKNQVAKAKEKDEFLLQEFCNFTQREMPVFQNGTFVFKPFKTTVGLFAYQGNFSGLYARVSEHNIIAGMERSISLPSLVAEEKGKHSKNRLAI